VKNITAPIIMRRLSPIPPGWRRPSAEATGAKDR
jgi:hypothetical protein